MQGSLKMLGSVLVALALLALPAWAQAPQGGGGPGGHGGGPGGGGHGAGPGGGPGGQRGGPRRGGRRGKPKGVNPAKAFDRLDTNGDGVIDATEWAANPRLSNDPLADADANNDGTVDAAEFEAFMIQKQFDRIDKNGDGLITAADFARGSSAGTLPQKLASADTDGNGEITLAEFTAHAQARAAAAAARQAAHQAFQAADANGDRKLEASEWPAGASATHAAVDADGDGFVTPREVHDYMQANGGASPF